MTLLAPTLQSFFNEYLVGQRGASGHTITSYRDTLRLLLGYVHDQTGIGPAQLDFSLLDAQLITGFLVMLEQDRSNTARTRNARLAAIHSLFRHAAFRHPEHADLIARVLAIPTKATDHKDVAYLSEAEVEALLASPDRSTRAGRRDYVLILVMVATGARVSEVTALTRDDVCTAAHGPHIAFQGKGRKDRITPIDTFTAKALRNWLAERSPRTTSVAVFPAQGADRRMTRDAVAQRLRHHAAAASTTCPSLASKTVTPHVLRHTCAMRMRAAGIDVATIALWLGHESPESSRPYLHADLLLKQRALDRTAPPRTRPGRYSPPDKLLAFLEAL